MSRHWMSSFLLLSTACELFLVALSAENVSHDMDMDSTRSKIVMAQFECYQKITKDSFDDNTFVFIVHLQTLNQALYILNTWPSSNNFQADISLTPLVKIISAEETLCNRTWDGWLCWDYVETGVTAAQHCPEYYQNFDTSEVATKICTETGHWFVHPESNRTWTNYTGCTQFTNERKKTALNLYYLALIGHGLSLISLFASLGIFFHFRSLSCQRITLHKNLFSSFVLNSIVTIILFTGVVNNQELIQANPVSCKVSTFIHLYILGCMYFWMLCEGIYLHTLIVVAVFAEKQHLMWYYLLGWGFPLIPALIHAIARSYYYNDNCWISSNTSLLYIIHGPICAALLVNLFFLLNIVRVLITKLKVTHQAESSLYMKTVRATLILVPLLGIQFVLLPYKPEGRLSSEIFEYMMNILMHFQGFLVATIFCFFNGEVQGVVLRHWNQYRMQFGGTFSNQDALRSAYYTASSMTEVHRCYSIDGHMDTLNGKSFHNMEATILRSDNLYM